MQRIFGGTVETHAPTAAESELAERCLSAMDLNPLYARVDLMQDDAGRLMIGELEVIEPELYLQRFPESAEVMAAAIVGRLRPAA